MTDSVDKLSGSMMVCGTTSDAGKTTIVAGLCRLLHRQGVSVAPFKAQNMALNSAVTVTGHEIGRAQYLQAQAAGIEPEVAMNPILLKPANSTASQVVVMGRPVTEMTAAAYHETKPDLFETVVGALEDLRSRFEVVLVEGAGSPAEINLLDRDLVNLGLAERAGMKSILVGNIDLGGVFASLFGTVKILPPNLSELIKGFVINQLRGDPSLLFDGTDRLEALSGVPTLGVVPMLDDLRLDAEDSLALNRLPPPNIGASLDVAVVRFPWISNFTDLDPLAYEPDVTLRYVTTARELGRPDLIVLPGSKSTVSDLTWLRRTGLAEAVEALASRGATVLGICGGYQMLGQRIRDEVESQTAETPGLALLPVSTEFSPSKVLTRPAATAYGHPVDGYQIHHGRVGATSDQAEAWLWADGLPEGFSSGPVLGTTLHGLFEADDFRRGFLSMVAARSGASFAPSTGSFTESRESELDRLADHLDEHLDIEQVFRLIEMGQLIELGQS